VQLGFIDFPRLETHFSFAGEQLGDFFGAALVARVERAIYPGDERSGVEGGEGKEEIRQISLHVDHDNWHPCAQRLFDEHGEEAGFTAARHADDDPVGHQVMRREQPGASRPSPVERQSVA
jgi:hypothetical protein